MGSPFETAIQDLNIINTQNTAYDLTLQFNDGTVMRSKNCYLDMFNKEGMESVDLYDEKGRNVVTVDFKPSACVYDSAHGATILPADSITPVAYTHLDVYKRQVSISTKSAGWHFFCFLRFLPAKSGMK